MKSQLHEYLSVAILLVVAVVCAKALPWFATWTWKECAILVLGYRAIRVGVDKVPK